MEQPNQVIVIERAEIVLGSDVFKNAAIITAVGNGVQAAQDAIVASGGDVTKDFKFGASVQVQKPPRKARTPAAPAPAAGKGGNNPPQPAT